MKEASRWKHIDASGRQSEVTGVPEVFAQGQGGLLDVALSPDFATDRTVFLSYSQGSAEGAGTSLFRAKLTGAYEGGFALEDGETIFSGNNKAYGGRHFGSRLVFAPDGTLFMTVGERGDGERAQDTSDHAGSVLRLTRDGQPAPGNPFVGQEATSRKSGPMVIAIRSRLRSILKPAFCGLLNTGHVAATKSIFPKPERTTAGR